MFGHPGTRFTQARCGSVFSPFCMCARPQGPGKVFVGKKSITALQPMTTCARFTPFRNASAPSSSKKYPWCIFCAATRATWGFPEWSWTHLLTWSSLAIRTQTDISSRNGALTHKQVFQIRTQTGISSRNIWRFWTRSEAGLLRPPTIRNRDFANLARPNTLPIEKQYWSITLLRTRQNKDCRAECAK